MSARVTTNGKQVILDGRHFADAANREAAEVIAVCLNIRADRTFVTTDVDRALLQDVLG